MEDAAKALGRLEALNRAGEFNEWHHGRTYAPMGVTCQAWSAGMYLFARECLNRSDVPDSFFGIGGGPG
jgi:glycogen debranching enzyme